MFRSARVDTTALSIFLPRNKSLCFIFGFYPKHQDAWARGALHVTQGIILRKLLWQMFISRLRNRVAWMSVGILTSSYHHRHRLHSTVFVQTWSKRIVYKNRRSMTEVYLLIGTCKLPFSSQCNNNHYTVFVIKSWVSTNTNSACNNSCKRHLKGDLL